MIEIGSTIFLELNDKSEGENKVLRFRCRLVDREDGTLMIDYPINQETKKPGFFYDGTQFRVWFIGKDDVMYAFDTEILGRKKSDIPMLILNDPGNENYIRIQRRNYVRVEATADVAVHPIDGASFTPFRTVTLDLSGGGAAIVIPVGVKMPHEGKVNCWFALHLQSGETAFVQALCKIIRIFRPRPEARERASLQFEEIEPASQQKMIRYCFERQLQLKRKNE
ncbi:flagellar brake protein [Halalkalibacterium ligniniphilum]|uniref:flagellar brake protein n=1 Tax=Halalkalibacterium ligniniphilum TaxID=1134413 RepID=UPI000345CB88|nr:flagellar brake domain-containing protein [Halalkalibacterium ligniniphilum]